MVFVYTTVGWLAVGTPPGPKAKSPPAKVAVVVPQPIPHEMPKPITPEPSNEPRPIVPDSPKEPMPVSEPPKEPMPSPAAVLTYERDILPILQRSCLVCHGKAKKRGKLDLSTFAAVLKGGDEGTALVPGKPAESPILTTILAGKMPPGGKKLPPRDIRTIREWIQSGARTDSSK